MRNTGESLETVSLSPPEPFKSKFQGSDARRGEAIGESAVARAGIIASVAETPANTLWQSLTFPLRFGLLSTLKSLFILLPTNRRLQLTKSDLLSFLVDGELDATAYMRAMYKPVGMTSSSCK